MIVVVGLSHRSAPVEVRERLAVPPEELPRRVTELRQQSRASELVLLSTCNRVEVIAAAQPGSGDTAGSVGARIVDHLEAGAPRVRPHLYLRDERPGLEHLFRTASALDSMVVGEPHILGQLKEAFACARGTGSVGPQLNRVFEHAFRVAKRVRCETSLGTGQVSVPTVAVDLAREIFNELAGHTVVLLGTGEIASALADLLGKAGARLVVVGRTLDRAREVAPRLGAEPRSWEDFPALLVEADIVVSSTSAPGYVVTQDQFSQNRRLRHGRNLFLVDLAVPRDIDPRIADLPGVFLYNVDDLAKVAEAALTDRRREAEKAAAIVSEETDSYLRRVHAERISPTLVALRERFRGALEAELERSMRGHRMPLDEQQKQSLHKALAAAVEKTLHLPTERLRSWAKDASFGDWHTDLLLAAIEELFDLPRSPAQEPLAKESNKP